MRRRQLRRVVRRLLDRREHRLHQRPQRHRLLQPRRLLDRAVRVLQGIPGQDRRLLGRVRPHHRRRHQRRDALGHERIRVRHRSRPGSRSSLQSSKNGSLRSPTAAPRIIGSYDEYDRTTATRVRVRPDHQGQAVLLRAVRGARLSAGQHRRRRRHASSTRKADNGFWGAKIDWQITDKHLLELLGVLGRERGSDRQLRLRLRRRRARLLRQHANSPTTAARTGRHLHRLSHRQLLDEGAVRRERARVLALSARTTSSARASATCDPARRRRRRLHRSRERHGAHRHSRGGAARLRVGRWATTSCASAWITRPTRRSTTSTIPGPDRLLYEIRRTERCRRSRTASRVPAGTEYVRTRQQRGRRRVRDDQLRLLPRGQLVGHAEPGAERAACAWKPSTTRTPTATATSRWTTWSRRASASPGT